MELTDKIKEYAKSINASWRKSTDSVIETARLCAEADKKFKASEKTKLLEVVENGWFRGAPRRSGTISRFAACFI
jgi:tellurite resistance protein